MDRRTEELLERGVAALEKLAQDEFEIKMETKPPVCPHCGKLNPTVRVGERDSTGPLVEYLVQAYCTHCRNIFYVIPFQVDCVRNTTEAQQVLDEKMRLTGFGYQGEDQAEAIGSNAPRANGM